MRQASVFKEHSNYSEDYGSNLAFYNESGIFLMTLLTSLTSILKFIKDCSWRGRRFDNCWLFTLSWRICIPSRSISSAPSIMPIRTFICPSIQGSSPLSRRNTSRTKLAVDFQSYGNWMRSGASNSLTTLSVRCGSLRRLIDELRLRDSSFSPFLEIFSARKEARRIIRR